MFRPFLRKSTSLGRDCGKKFFSEIKVNRSARRNADFDLKKAPSNFQPIAITAAITLFFLGGYLIYDDIEKNPKGVFGEYFYTHFKKRSINEMLPVNSALPEYPDDRTPPLLVIDFEGTLVGSVHDVVHGFRYARRPGYDKFIEIMSKYYEIVIFSDADDAEAAEIIDAIDPKHLCHRRGKNALDMDGHKLLNSLGRDLSRVIVIDDNPEAVSLFPRNSLIIKKFDKLNDKNDKELLKIIPLLQAFIHENIPDFRDALDGMGTHSLDEAAIEYQRRVSMFKSKEMEKRNRGLGGWIRKLNGKSEQLDSEPDVMPQSAIPSTLSIVGTTREKAKLAMRLTEETQENTSTIPLAGFQHPKEPVVKKKGEFFEWLENVQKDKEEADMRRRERMQELMVKKMEAQEAEEKKKKDRRRD